AKCGQSTVYVQNQATAGLYNYTPYQPNAALLSGKPNSCSSYGNYNFFTIFGNWFGNTGSLLKNASFELGKSSWTSGATGSITRTAKSDPDQAKSGSGYIVVTAPKAGRRLQQDIKRKLNPGEMFTGSVWLRADKPGATVHGKLKLYTLGGTKELAQIPF